MQVSGNSASIFAVTRQLLAPTTLRVKHQDSEGTLGERLRRAMRRSKLGNEELAKSAGVHVTTISKWLSDRQIPDAVPLDRAAARLGVTSQWLRHGDARGGTGGIAELQRAYSGLMVREPTSVAISDEIPQAARSLIRRFEAEATDLGATEGEIQFIRRVLTMPETYALYGENAARIVDGLEALMRGLRTWLTETHGR